jgi:hypothetical protein
MPMNEPVRDASLTETIAAILSLQTQYSPENTDEMKRRGDLIRSVLPSILNEHADRYAQVFAKAGYAASVEGKDGIGRKAMSAWVRIYDEEMSPSATQGWYIVIHFSSQGDYFYLTLGCGATVFKGGSLVDVDDDDLLSKIHWAQHCFKGKPGLIAHFSDKIVLHGNHLSTQFEKATAFAKRYQLAGFDQASFWRDVTTMSEMLVSIYESERLGKVPLSEAPEVREYQSQLSQTVRPKRKSGRGQGRFLSPLEKSAVELHAMATVRAALSERGFIDIEDKSANASYDFSAKKDGTEWFIEVKGTTSAYSDSFLLTANELDLHQAHKGQTVLAIVYDIDLDRKGDAPKAQGGKLSIDIPWDPNLWDFKPTAYSASRRTS